MVLKKEGRKNKKREPIAISQGTKRGVEKQLEDEVLSGCGSRRDHPRAVEQEWLFSKEAAGGDEAAGVCQTSPVSGGSRVANGSKRSCSLTRTLRVGGDGHRRGGRGGRRGSQSHAHRCPTGPPPVAGRQQANIHVSVGMGKSHFNCLGVKQRVVL